MRRETKLSSTILLILVICLFAACHRVVIEPTPKPTELPTQAPTETTEPTEIPMPTATLIPTPTEIPTPTQVPTPQNLIVTLEWITDDPYDKHFNRFKDMSESRGDSITGTEDDGWLIIHKGIGLSVYIGPSEIKENGDVTFELGSGTIKENGEAKITNRNLVTTSKGVTLLLCPKATTFGFIYCPYINNFVRAETDGDPAFLRDCIWITSSKIYITPHYNYDDPEWCVSDEYVHGEFVDGELFYWGWDQDGNLYPCPKFEISDLETETE